MKIILTLLLLPLLALAQGPPIDIFGNNGNGNQGNGGGDGDAFIKPNAPFPDDGPAVPQHVIDKFRERSNLKSSWVANAQRVPKGAASFRVGGKRVKFNKLIPVDDLYEPNARVFVDGVPQPRTVHVYKDPQDPNVRVVLDDDGFLMRASRYMGASRVMELLHLTDDVFSEFGSEDVDYTTVSAIVNVSLFEEEESLFLVLLLT